MGAAIAKADRLAQCLKSSEWDVIEIIRKRTPGLSQATAIVDSMAGALRDDEHVTALQQQLAEQHRRALDLLETPQPPPPEPPPVAPPGTPEIRHIRKQGATVAGVREVMREVEEILSKDPDLRADIECRVFRTKDSE